MARLIDNLLDRQADRQEMGLAGQARVRDFIAWDHQVRRTYPPSGRCSPQAVDKVGPGVAEPGVRNDRGAPA